MGCHPFITAGIGVYSIGFNMGRQLDELSVSLATRHLLYYIIVLFFYVIGE